MSIVRLSFVKGTLRKTRPSPEGAEGDLDLTDGGALDVFGAATPAFGATPKLKAFLTGELASKAKKLTKDQPVIVMAHGFWYDPHLPVGDKKTANPHGLNYHFKDPKNPHWRHTSGWPRELGIQENGDQDSEGGANGLVVAFGWDSTPTILKSGDAGNDARGKASKTVFSLKIFNLNLTNLKELETFLKEVDTYRKEVEKLFGDLRTARDALESLKENQEARKLAEAFRESCDYLTALGALLRSPKFSLKYLNEVNSKKQEAKDAILKLPDLIGKALQSESEEVIPIVDLIAQHVPKEIEIYAEAYKRADNAAAAFANAINAVVEKLPGRRIDLFCHSLGSRVVISALLLIAKEKPALLNPCSGISRVLIVGGAEYQQEARTMLAAVQNATKGDCPAFYNFMGRRDRVLTHLAGEWHPIDKALTKPIGCFGLGKDPHWIDLQLDKDKDGNHELNVWLAKHWMKEEVSGTKENAVGSAHPLGILNHWYYFTNPTNMKLFNAILRERADWNLSRLRAKRIPDADVGVVM